MSAETAAARAETPGGDPLLTAKLLVPEIRCRLTVRQRLVDRLDEGARWPLTVVSGPAGAGKTALVSSWVTAGRAPGRVAWISLDAHDDQPGVFWSYVLAAVARSDVDLPAVPAPRRPDSVDGSLLTALAARLSEHDRPTVLVLDDIDRLRDETVLAGIDFLIRHAAPRLRVIAIGRTVPALPLHRYRLAGWVTELDARDLVFGVAETAELLAAADVHLDTAGLALLTERTEGWAAGLRMAAMSLRGRKPRDRARIVRRFRGDRGDVADYFWAEVLAGRPTDVRAFLLDTSVVDSLAPELAEVLGARDDGARLLRSLAGDNAFVTASDDGGYRYHRLFREALIARLRRESPGRVTDLHRAAADWLTAHEQPVAAARHAAAAGDWARAAGIVVEHLSIGRLLTGPESAQLARLFQRMPAELDDAPPAIIRATLAVLAHDEPACTRQLSIAGERDTARAPQVRLAIGVIETVIAAERMDVERTMSAAAVVMNLSANLPTPAPADLRAIVLTGKGSVQMWSGDLRGAEDSLLAALRAADNARLDRLKVRTLGRLALLRAIHGRLRQAARSAHQAGQLADRLGLADGERPAGIDVAFAWIHTERGDIAAARRHLRSTAPPNDPLSAAALAVVRERHQRGTHGSAAAPWPPWLASDRRPGAAVRDVAAQVDTWLRTAARELDQGRTELATRALSRALRLAAPEHLRRQIVEAPAPVRRLLQFAPQLADQHPWLAGDGAAARPEPALVEPLTEREYEVLRNMAALLSTDEIARAMFVSVNTVKTHVRAVLRKLGVNRRNDAIRRARTLGLLS